MADSMKWVSFRPTEDTLKASREKACFPTRNVYLKEKKIENSQERCSKALLITNIQPPLYWARKYVVPFQDAIFFVVIRATQKSARLQVKDSAFISQVW